MWIVYDGNPRSRRQSPSSMSFSQRLPSPTVNCTFQNPEHASEIIPMATRCSGGKDLAMILIRPVARRLIWSAIFSVPCTFCLDSRAAHERTRSPTFGGNFELLNSFRIDLGSFNSHGPLPCGLTKVALSASPGKRPIAQAAPAHSTTTAVAAVRMCIKMQRRHIHVHASVPSAVQPTVQTAVQLTVQAAVQHGRMYSTLY